MTVVQASLAEQVQAYRAKWPGEAACCDRFIELLLHKDAFQRTHLPGHITGSAFIVSPDHQRTLLVHHAKLNKWLQPGGHADGDTDVTGVALREANEETGILRLTLVSAAIFDLDIHPIPARADFPQHDHYDVRYLFVASTDDPIVVSHESFDVRWINLGELDTYNKESSILRLRTKIHNASG